MNSFNLSDLPDLSYVSKSCTLGIMHTVHLGNVHQMKSESYKKVHIGM